MLFSRLPQWEEAAERPQPQTISIPPADAEAKLAELTGEGAEPREGQRAMAGEAAAIFAPRRAAGEPNMLLAEAGTGIGKTLGLSRARLALGRAVAGGTVWVSTFTKALQRQLDAEGRRLFPDAEERKRRIVIRKGRENYLCLLNLEDALQGALRRARGDPGAAGRALGGLSARTATWSAATCPAGCRACSAAPARPR